MSWRESMKHAFAVESSDAPPEPTPEQREAIDRWCAALVRQRLYHPAFRLVGQELAQPLNYVTSQAMQFFRPALRTMASDRFDADYGHLAGFLEHRGSTAYIAARLAALESAEADSPSSDSSDPESGGSPSDPPTSPA